MLLYIYYTIYTCTLNYIYTEYYKCILCVFYYVYLLHFKSLWLKTLLIATGGTSAGGCSERQVRSLKSCCFSVTPSFLMSSIVLGENKQTNLKNINNKNKTPLSKLCYTISRSDMLLKQSDLVCVWLTPFLWRVYECSRGASGASRPGALYSSVTTLSFLEVVNFLSIVAEFICCCMVHSAGNCCSRRASIAIGDV